MEVLSFDGQSEIMGEVNLGLAFHQALEEVKKQVTQMQENKHEELRKRRTMANHPIQMSLVEFGGRGNELTTLTESFARSINYALSNSGYQLRLEIEGHGFKEIVEQVE